MFPRFTVLILLHFNGLWLQHLPRGSRVQTTGQKVYKFGKKSVKIVEFYYNIRNHHEKCIQISSNLPSIGFVIPVITCEMLEFGEN